MSNLSANPLSDFCGIKIVESPHAVTRERVKTYPKRKAKSSSHWRRMDKKWLKRYGHREKPAMFMMDVGFSGLGRGKTLVCHPALMAKVRAATQVAA